MTHDIDLVLKQIIVATTKEGLGIEIPIEEISDDTDLIYDLGFHSIVSIRFIAAVEKILGVDIDDDNLDNELINKYSRLRDYVIEHIDD
ncbi:acyl carrier protein [Clostridium botulinum]|nr:acyl carrier protein [Clostridium botulinum]